MDKLEEIIHKGMEEMAQGIAKVIDNKLAEKDKEIERLRIEKDFWKTTMYAELEEHYDEPDNEIYDHERALEQALKERK